VVSFRSGVTLSAASTLPLALARFLNAGNNPNIATGKYGHGAWPLLSKHHRLQQHGHWFSSSL